MQEEIKTQEPEIIKDDIEREMEGEKNQEGEGGFEKATEGIVEKKEDTEKQREKELELNALKEKIHLLEKARSDVSSEIAGSIIDKGKIIVPREIIKELKEAGMEIETIKEILNKKESGDYDIFDKAMEIDEKIDWIISELRREKSQLEAA